MPRSIKALDDRKVMGGALWCVSVTLSVGGWWRATLTRDMKTIDDAEGVVGLQSDFVRSSFVAEKARALFQRVDELCSSSTNSQGSIASLTTA
jgi:hypothetical protein